MNWITTNLRIPEDIYMELKMEAARERKSVAAVIRQRLSSKNSRQVREKETKDLLVRMEKLGKKISKENPGLDLSKALIEMRYEQ